MADLQDEVHPPTEVAALPLEDPFADPLDLLGAPGPAG